MNHDQAWPLLDRYLDGDLDPESRWAIAGHLADCPTCRGYLARQARLRTVVRRRLRATTVPPDLGRRLHAALAAERPPTPIRPFFQRTPAFMVGVAALLIALAVAGSWLLVRPRTAEPAPPLDLPAELVAPHNLFARDETLLEARGDPSTVGAWLSTRVGFRVSVPALADFDLAGGRLVTVDGRPAAQLVYEREATHEYVSLLYFNTGRDGLPGLHPTDGFAVGQQGDVTVVAWTGTGPDTALIAARPATDLLRLATDLAGRR